MKRKAEEKRENPYDLRREENVGRAVSFAEASYDSVLEAMDSISMFRMRLNLLKEKESFRINPESADSLISSAKNLEGLLESAYEQAESIMLQIEAGKLD